MYVDECECGVCFVVFVSGSLGSCKRCVTYSKAPAQRAASPGRVLYNRRHGSRKRKLSVYRVSAAVFLCEASFVPQTLLILVTNTTHIREETENHSRSRDTELVH